MGDDTDFTIEYTSVYHPDRASSAPSAQPDIQDRGAPASPHMPASSSTPLTSSPTAEAPPVESVTPPPAAEEDLDVDADDTPLRFRHINNVLGPTTPLGLATRELGPWFHHIDNVLGLATRGWLPGSSGRLHRRG
ncbi:hypothetical protein E2562_035134 [Oryza meyeriana var. granulata]|uniref:Uncharacterized protein n=1 Tax=Oryza meyeriana var. granulata TaxID=110450 RepID=A0A6G1BQ90_9ORYZ|nr:hypothetical protein E2562_035134 [Oryza meyeriana var. granulata]